MGILLIVLFPLMSFNLIIMMVGFAPHLSLRGGALLINFGALIFSIILIKIVILNESTIIISTLKTLVPISFNLCLNPINTLLLLNSLLSLIIIIFFLSPKRFNNSLIMLCICFSNITLPYVFFNPIVSLSVYSIGCILISYFSIINNDKKLSISHLTDDFMWQRISDIAAFLSLMLILINEKNIFAPELITSTDHISHNSLLFFGAMILRLIIMPGANRHARYSIDNGYNYFVLGRIFSCLGALLFLVKMHNIIFYSTKINNFYLLISGIMMTQAIFYLIKYNRVIYLPINISNFLIISALSTLCLGYIYMALIIISAIIIIAPSAILLTSNPKFAFKKTGESAQMSVDPVAYIGGLAQNCAQFGATLAARLASIFYANLIFYRLPQLIISFFQIPLRIFHTGSLQRSLLFIVLLIASYYWLWG